MIRLPVLLLAFLMVACGAQAQRATSVPQIDPRHGRIDELEESISVAHEQLSGGGAMCTDVCRLADDICRSQEDICRIAGEVPADSWAHERCEQAIGSCRDARDRCMACR